MSTALIISRYFPPLSSAGASIRLVKLIKYAAEQDWHFTIMTQDPDRPVIPEKRLSEFLCSEIPEGTQIIRIGNPFFGQSITARLGRKLFRSSSLPWGLSVAWHGWRKLHRIKPDLIFVNSPPFTNVAVGLALAKSFSVPFVLDMKDDWVDSPAYWKKGRLRRRIERWIEQIVVIQAAATVIVTRASYEAWIKRYSTFGLAAKIHLISNGLDLDEYQNLKEQERKPESQYFTMTSAAAGYRPDYRDLLPFLNAVELFLENHPQARTQIRITFLGEDPDSSYKTILERILPSTSIQYMGPQNRQAMVEHLWQADLFFLVQPKENFTAISGTLYEYWATGKAPTLLFAENGASSDLVEKNHFGKSFNFNQVRESSEYIGQVYQAFNRRTPIWIERSGVEGYDRRKMVRKLVSVWEEAIKTFQG